MYEVLTDQAGIEFAEETRFEELSDARELAERLATENKVELEVVHTATGAVAYVATYVTGRIFHAWERVETPRFEAPHIEGYRPAYQRVRIGAVVYRPLEKGEPWLVLHNGRRYLRPTTAGAREVTNALRRGEEPVLEALLRD